MGSSQDVHGGNLKAITVGWIMGRWSTMRPSKFFFLRPIQHYFRSEFPVYHLSTPEIYRLVWYMSAIYRHFTNTCADEDVVHSLGIMTPCYCRDYHDPDSFRAIRNLFSSIEDYKKSCRKNSCDEQTDLYYLQYLAGSPWNPPYIGLRTYDPKTIFGKPINREVESCLPTAA